jgi:hypothetical protein
MTQRFPFQGVRLRESGKWIARIQKDKKQYFLGTFDTKREARKAYEAAVKKFFTSLPYHV